MLTRMRLTNFRCFDETEIGGLKRVNLVIGPNGSGKTALLEALFLLLGSNPELALRFKMLRGVLDPGTFRLSLPSFDVARLWDDLFFGLDRQRRLEIAADDTLKGSRRLVVAQVEERVKTIPLGERPATVEAPVSFTLESRAGAFTMRPVATPGGLRVEEIPHPELALFFPAHFRTSAEETAQRLSELSKRNAAEQVLAPLRRLFPEVRGLSVENDAGNWAVYFELSAGLPRIPAVYHSAGAGKYLDYLLGIAAYEAHTLLIDEFDNGLYYATLERAWRGVFELAEARGAQIFATTHSRECIEAVLPLLTERPDAFNVIRMAGGGGKRVSVETLDTHAFAAAVEQGYEVR
jgi:energy-coupling factor transporter ATP-binding protein EcfA2